VRLGARSAARLCVCARALGCPPESLWQRLLLSLFSPDKGGPDGEGEQSCDQSAGQRAADDLADC